MVRLSWHGAILLPWARGHLVLWEHDCQLPREIRGAKSWRDIASRLLTCFGMAIQVFLVVHLQGTSRHPLLWFVGVTKTRSKFNGNPDQVVSLVVLNWGRTAPCCNGMFPCAYYTNWLWRPSKLEQLETSKNLLPQLAQKRPNFISQGCTSPYWARKLAAMRTANGVPRVPVQKCSRLRDKSWRCTWNYS